MKRGRFFNLLTDEDIEMSMIELMNVFFAYDKELVLKDLSFDIHQGEFLSIIGPNGSGKTTLLRLFSRVIEPKMGEIRLKGKDINKIKRKELAKTISVVPQDSFINFPFSVLDVVLMGRYPYLENLSFEKKEDLEMARKAMILTDIFHLSQRDINDLSGGERQRAIIARALTQQPEILLLDEFTSSLDLNHKIEIYELIKRLNIEKSLTIINVSHDLNIASEYADRLLLLNEGSIHSLGTPREVLKRDIIRDVFECNVLIEDSPVTGSPYVIPLNSNLRIEDRRKIFRIHVISGEGKGSVLMRRLFIRGFEITAGVLNIGDTDQIVGEALGISMVLEKPFSAISEQAFLQNLEMIEKADLVVMGKFRIGKGNVRNLEVVLEGLKRGKEFFIVDNDLDYDFTGGDAKRIYELIRERGGIFVKNHKDLIKKIDTKIKDMV